MPFNATTYRMNKYRKSRDERMAIAREVKARAEKNEAYGWEIDRIPVHVKLAFIDHRLFMSHRRMKAAEDAQKAIR